MAGGIQPGGVATSIQSATAEKNHNLIVEQVAKTFPRVELRKSMTIVDICKMNNPDYEVEYSFCKNGTSQKWLSDGGFIYIDGVLSGVAECKYQKAVENACERAGKYSAWIKALPAERTFITCHGPGFEKRLGGGSTGPMIDVARSAGATVLVNPTPEKQEEEFRIFLKNLIESA